MEQKVINLGLIINYLYYECQLKIKNNKNPINIKENKMLYLNNSETNINRLKKNLKAKLDELGKEFQK